MAPSSPGRRDYLCLTKIIKRHFHWNICRLKFAGIFGYLTTRDCMKLTSCQSMKKYEYFVSNSPGRGRDCWWRPPLWCSPEGARRCAGSSCWSPGSPRRSHLFSSSHQNTPGNTFELHEGRSEYLHLSRFEHCLWFSNFSRCFQCHFLPRIAIEHSKNMILRYVHWKKIKNLH